MTSEASVNLRLGSPDSIFSRMTPLVRCSCARIHTHRIFELAKFNFSHSWENTMPLYVDRCVNVFVMRPRLDWVKRTPRCMPKCEQKEATRFSPIIPIKFARPGSQIQSPDL